MKKRIPIIILSVLFSIIIWTSVNLSGSFYTTLRLPLKIINIRDGYGIATAIPETVTVKLKAVGWNIIGLQVRGDLEYMVSTGPETGNTRVTLLNSVPDNNWVSSYIQVIDVWPSYINLKLDKLDFKRLPVKPDISIEFKEEFGLAKSILSYPDSVNVEGTSKFLDSLKFVETVPLEFFNIDQSFSTEADIKKKPGISFKPYKVNLYFDVQKIVDREIEEIPVIIRDMPPDRSIILLPDRIDISIRGGINILGKINREEIEAYIKYSDIILDTLGSLSPRINVPKNTKVLFKKPDRVKYIIKKF
ncbi:MAG: YbbR-like domain-containing protein [Ignavibacteriaceae bacterium]